jgi:hypothetical protein
MSWPRLASAKSAASTSPPARSAAAKPAAAAPAKIGAARAADRQSRRHAPGQDRLKRHGVRRAPEVDHGGDLHRRASLAPAGYAETHGNVRRPHSRAARSASA